MGQALMHSRVTKHYKCMSDLGVFGLYTMFFIILCYNIFGSQKTPILSCHDSLHSTVSIQYECDMTLHSNDSLHDLGISFSNYTRCNKPLHTPRSNETLQNPCPTYGFGADLGDFYYPLTHDGPNLVNSCYGMISLSYEFNMNNLKSSGFRQEDLPWQPFLVTI